MICPKCNEEMIPYKIWGDRWKLRTSPASKKLFLGFLAIGTEPIGNGSASFILDRPNIDSHRCINCKIQIIDESEN